MDYILEKRPVAYITDMLVGGNNDNCLVLAYGYFDGRQIPAEVLWRWLSASDHNHLVLVIGVHGSQRVDPFIAARDGIGNVPMTELTDDEKSNLEKSIANLKKMFASCPWNENIIDTYLLPPRSARIHILFAEHFHAKLAMTATVEPGFSLFTGQVPDWVPTSALFGSSNLTNASHTYNIEFDVLLKRKDPALTDLRMSSQGLVQLALDRAMTAGSVSRTVSERAIRTIYDQLQAQKWARHTEALRQQDADYETARREADEQLD
jgi:hypothetical protein